MTDQDHAPEHDNPDDLVNILHDLNARIGDNKSGEKIRLGELLALMHTQGITLCILILALPSFFPGLLPPFPSFLAAPMLLLGWQLVRQREQIWLPGFLYKMPLGRKIIVTMITKFIHYLNKLPVRKKDAPFILHGRNEVGIGLSIMLFACIIFIPLPLTNFLPSVGAAFVMVGCLKQSRFYTLIGLAIGYVGVVVGISAVVFGVLLVT